MSMAEAAENAEVQGETNETQLSETEQRAVAMGWAPKDEFKGNPDDWVEAEEFIDSTPTKLRRKLKESDARYSDLEKRFASLQTGVKQMEAFQETAREEGYQKGLKEALEKLKAAAKEGDDAGMAAAESEMEQIEEQRQKDAQAAQNTGVSEQEAQTFGAWKSDNGWYEKDIMLRGAADAVSRQLTAMNPNMPLDAHLEEVARQVKGEFPDRFKTAKADPPAVESGGNNGGGIPARNRSRGWNDLPSDCKSAFRELVQAGAYKDDKDGRAKYATSYFTQYPDE